MFQRVGRRGLLFILILTLLLTSTACGRKKAVDIEVEEDYIAVETQKVELSKIANTRKFSGRVVANEEVMIVPKIPGIVESVNVELGQRVKKDSVLFVLEQDDISKGVWQADASVNLAIRGIEQAKNALETAMANYELTKERIDKAVMDLERTRELYDQGAISKSQLEQAELAASSNQLEVAERQVNQAEIAVRQAEEQLNQAQISHSQAVDNVDNTVVKAPMEGIISTLNVKKGQLASSGQVAVSMVDLDRVYVQIDLTEDVVNRLELNQKARVKIPAAFEGERDSVIEYISPTADVGNKLYSVKIYIENEDKKIRPGMNGEVNLNLEEIEDVIAVNTNAVLDEDGEDVVYVVEDNRAVRRVVQLGFDNGEYVEIREGLSQGEELVTKGQHYVEDGKKVKVIGGE